MEKTQPSLTPIRHDRSGRIHAFEVQARLHHHYHVVYQAGLLSRYGRLFLSEIGNRMVVVLTDTRVQRLYGPVLASSFQEVGMEPGWLVVPEGEKSKRVEMYCRLLDQMAELGIDRRAVLVNFGGGVISDLGGFLASSYLRGIHYVNLSTSFLGQADACVGGKVGVNVSRAKNFVGAFYHPRHVAGDPALLRTLSERDYRSGLAEAIKVAIIMSPEYFRFLEKNRSRILDRDSEILVHVVGEAARYKMNMISRDPYENDLRRPLNFGHTLGHPIETEFQYRNIRHGEAVAIGMGVSTAIAVLKGILSESEAERIYSLLDAYGLLGFSEPIRPDRVVEHIRYVRLVRANHLHFVLPKAVGGVEVTDDVTNADLIRGFEAFNEVVQWKKA